MAKRVLLIADLEGIPGVDRLESLIIGGDGDDAAIEAMQKSTLEVVELLRADGATHVRISDAHRSGASQHLEPARFPGCELCFTDDMYAGELLNDIDAVCAVGMHASAGSKGFAGHTVSLHTDWRLGSQLLNESTLAQLLASERGIPMWFTCGDDVLAREVPTMPCVVTKRSTSPRDTSSFDPTQISDALRNVFTRRNTALVPVPRAPLTITFQRAVEADAAVAAGATRASATSIVLEPHDTFFAQYTAALKFIDVTNDVLMSQFRAIPGTPQFARQVTGLFERPWES